MLQNRYFSYKISQNYYKESVLFLYDPERGNTFIVKFLFYKMSRFLYRLTTKRVYNSRRERA